MALKVYGIPNCDTIKKTKKYLEENNTSYEFVDYKKVPPTAAQIKSWGDQLGELPINKRGTTFRKIKDSYERATVTEKIKLMSENYASIKRPLIEKNGEVVGLGFTDEVKGKL